MLIIDFILFFQLEMFARHEDAVRVATSLFGLVSQDFRIDKVLRLLVISGFLSHLM
jgi:hypothetical protein